MYEVKLVLAHHVYMSYQSITSFIYAWNYAKIYCSNLNW